MTQTRNIKPRLRKAKALYHRYAHEEARGSFMVTRGHYGPEFSVTANGHTYTGMIDLFHFSQEDEAPGYIQVVLDPPDNKEGNTFHLRQKPDGSIDTFTE